MSANSTLSHEIADVLRDEILRQRYHSGDRLPSERDLAARFGASRGAVREALSQIEQLGLIRIMPGGARVQEIEAASIAILGPLLALDEQPDPVLVDQFLQTFGALSALTTRIAVERATAEQLRNIKDMVAALAAYEGDFAGIQPKWREFLDYLTTIADNLVVRLIGNHLKAQFVEQMLKLGIRPNPGKQAMVQLFYSLRLAVSNQDGALAGAAVQDHFDEIRAAVRNAIDEMSPALREASV